MCVGATPAKHKQWKGFIQAQGIQVRDRRDMGVCGRDLCGWSDRGLSKRRSRVLRIACKSTEVKGHPPWRKRHGFRANTNGNSISCKQCSSMIVSEHENGEHDHGQTLCSTHALCRCKLIMCMSVTQRRVDKYQNCLANGATYIHNVKSNGGTSLCSQHR